MALKKHVKNVNKNAKYLRTFAQKSFHIEISFIIRLKLGHKLLIGKMEKNSGDTDFVSETKAREKCPNFDRWIIITRCSLIYSSVEYHKNNMFE